MKLNAVCIDDEPQGVERIARCCAELPSLIELSGSAHDAEAGLILIEEKQPDVVFLDVEMPGKTGLEMLDRSSERDFEVVIVSAHEKFAFEAYQKQVFHYLLKPFSTHDFKQTLERIIAIKTGRYKSEKLAPKSEHSETNEGQSRLSVSTQEGTYVLDPERVLWCEADGSYTIIHLQGGERILASKSIRHFDETLGKSGFMRVHKSSLVNLTHVEFVDLTGGIRLRNSTDRIQVSVRKRQELFRKLSFRA